MMLVKPSVHRVIPVEKNIQAGIEVVPYERVSYYIENAQSWGVLPCICRVQRSLVGHNCVHSKENCMVFHNKPGVFNGNASIRAITKEEAFKILAEADREGLVHSTSNVREDVTYICNCCSCSCGILRGMTEYGYTDAVAKSDFYARVDESLCIGCESCIGRCPFKALEMSEGVVKVDRDRCYGCGLCVTVCPSKALALVLKAPCEIIAPPQTEADWLTERAKSRQS